MTETGVLVQNCWLFRGMFGDRQLCVKQMQHSMLTRVTTTIWRTRIESNYKFLPQTKKNCAVRYLQIKIVQ
jgi:hypothetical protein